MSMHPFSRSGGEFVNRSERALQQVAVTFGDDFKDHRRRDSGIPQPCTFNTSGCFVGEIADAMGADAAALEHEIVYIYSRP